MKIPRKIHAYGFDYKVKLKKKVKDEGKMWNGLISHHRLEIELCNEHKLNRQVIEKNFFHEITHLIGCEAGVKLTERNVSAIANGFYSILKDNKLLK